MAMSQVLGIAEQSREGERGTDTDLERETETERVRRKKMCVCVWGGGRDFF